MIHYHGGPLWPTKMAAELLHGRHGIISYYRPDQIRSLSQVLSSFIIDNGAFSAWRAKQLFNFDGYEAFVKMWGNTPNCDWYIIPDEIDGDEAANKRLVEEWAAKQLACEGVPVYHMHESFEYLEWLVQNFRRICIGSSGQWPTPGAAKWHVRMQDIMGVVCDSDGFPRTKLHGLRMLDPRIFSLYPFSSCDSTNVARNAGNDAAWNHPKLPRDPERRAQLLLMHIEKHASAWRWACNDDSLLG
jgi:hypothetical protein